MILYWVGIGLAISFLLVFMWKLVRCVHAWELVDKTEFAPPILVYVQSGGSRNHSGYLSDNQIEQMSKKKVVLVLRCPKCGAARIEHLVG